MGSFLENFGAVDIVSTVIVVFFFVLGLFKGFTWQILRIATILVGMAVAKAFSSSFSKTLESTFSSLEGKEYTQYISYFTIFVGVFIVGTIVAILFGKILKNLRLRAYDSLLGGVLGILTGGAVVTVVILVMLTMLPEDSEFRSEVETSHSAKCSAWFIDKATPLIPAELREKATTTVEKAVRELKEKSDHSPTETDDEDEGR